MASSAPKKAGSITGRLIKDVGKLAMRGTKTHFSSSMEESRKQVFALYRACMAAVPVVLENYEFTLLTRDQAKAKVKEMFVRNKDLSSLQAIDMVRINGEMELKEFVLMYKTIYNIEQILTPDLKLIQSPEKVHLSGQPTESKFLKSFFRGGN